MIDNLPLNDAAQPLSFALFQNCAQRGPKIVTNLPALTAACANLSRMLS